MPSARGVEVATFDLADLGSVRAWAQRAQDFGLPLDVLVNNAGGRGGGVLLHRGSVALLLLGLQPLLLPPPPLPPL